MKYPIDITTEPANEPVTLDEAKEFFREDRDIEDVLIDNFVIAARKLLERHTGYHFIDTVLEMRLTDFEDVKIPRKPVKSGSVSIEYVDEDGATQTLATDKYNIHEADSPVEIEFLDDLPDLDEEEDTKYPVIITFTAGFGTSASNVPQQFRNVISLLAMLIWKREIPDKDFNPLNLGVVRMQINDRMVGRFK